MTLPTTPGFDIASVSHGGITELFATVLPGPASGLSSPLRRASERLRGDGAELLEVRVFGTLAAAPATVEELSRVFASVDWPVTWVEGADCSGGEVAGIQIHAVRGTPVRTLALGGTPVGRAFEDAHAHHMVFGNLQPAQAGPDRSAQAADAFRRLEEGLALGGMDLRDVVRTWFFLDDILGWYSEFNAVRSGLYRERGIFERYLPASTGIGGRNPGGTALAACVRAMRPKGESGTVREIPSPLQCAPGHYGSSFSRAAELTAPDLRAILVSGTASIDAEGVTMHVGDVEAQVARTFEVVAAILESRGAGFGDVTRANAYFKHPGDAAVLPSYLDRYGLPPWRVIVSNNDVCRDALLFEIELEAATGEPGVRASAGTPPARAARARGAR
ncbi:MAG: translation initiation inhibitor [Gemmatimonadetes bacterium]|nr:translation initiation inhibitor [Gemmatimonadota bacterium]